MLLDVLRAGASRAYIAWSQRYAANVKALRWSLYLSVPRALWLSRMHQILRLQASVAYMAHVSDRALR